MPETFNLPFVLSVVGAFLTSSVVAYTYVWPAVSRNAALWTPLRLLAAFHAFRFLGMNFSGIRVRIFGVELRFRL